MATPDPVDPATLEIKTRSIEQTLLPLVKQVRLFFRVKTQRSDCSFVAPAARRLSFLSLSVCNPLSLSLSLSVPPSPSLSLSLALSLSFSPSLYLSHRPSLSSFDCVSVCLTLVLDLRSS